MFKKKLEAVHFHGDEAFHNALSFAKESNLSQEKVSEIVSWFYKVFIKAKEEKKAAQLFSVFRSFFGNPTSLGENIEEKWKEEVRNTEN